LKVVLQGALVAPLSPRRPP